MKLYFLKLIPLGWHTIRLVKMDKKTNTISSQESGLLAQVWNHNISFREVGSGKVSYTDEIEIQAGCLTPAIWLFAHIFYRYRQRRWKVLLKKNSTEIKMIRYKHIQKTIEEPDAVICDFCKREYAAEKGSIWRSRNWMPSIITSMKISHGKLIAARAGIAAAK